VPTIKEKYEEMEDHIEYNFGKIGKNMKKIDTLTEANAQ